MFTWCLASISSLFASKEVTSFKIHKDHESFDVHRYNNENYVILDIGKGNAYYRVTTHEGVRTAFIVDVTEKSAKNFCKTCKEILKREKKNIDLLINNAGILHHGLFTMAPISEIRAVFNVNVMAPIILMQSVIRKMQRQKSGNIVNLCSIAGLDSHPGDSIYGQTLIKRIK